MMYYSTMEYYKEEAARAREISERMFLAKDIAGAKKFAMKAQFLYPELDGIARMVATFVVLLSVQNRAFGEIDCYRLLGLNPEADDETVRKRYKNLVVMLHPDRNKSVGADEAFKFLTQAWSVVSDQARRADYDLRRNVKGGASASTPANNEASGNTTKVKSSKRGIKRESEASSSAATISTPAHKTGAEGTKNAVHAAQTGSRHEKVVRREYNKGMADVSSTIPSKRRKIMETSPTAAGANTASCSAAKTTSVIEVSKAELKNLLKKKAKAAIIIKLQELRITVAETEADTNGRKIAI